MNAWSTSLRFVARILPFSWTGNQSTAIRPGDGDGARRPWHRADFPGIDAWQRVVAFVSCLRNDGSFDAPNVDVVRQAAEGRRIVEEALVAIAEMAAAKTRAQMMEPQVEQLVNMADLMPATQHRQRHNVVWKAEKDLAVAEAQIRAVREA